MEQEDEEEEVDEEETMTGGRTGKKVDVKAEEKPEVNFKGKSCGLIKTDLMHQTLKFVLRM